MSLKPVFWTLLITFLWAPSQGNADTSNPAVSIASPTHEESLTLPALLEGNATDDTALDRVELLIRNLDTNEYWNGTELQSGYTRIRSPLSGEPTSSSWSYQLDSIANGNYYLAAFVWDASGNRPSPPVSRRFSVVSTVQDVSAPTGTIVSPAPDANLNSPVGMSGTATDDISVDRVELVIKNLDDGTFWNGTDFSSAYTRVNPILTGSAGNRDWNYSFDSNQLGNYFVSLWIWDTSNNRIVQPVTHRFSIVPSDTVPPSASFSTPKLSASVVSPVLVSGIASDSSGIDRVELVIKNTSTNQFWNGSDFQTSYTRVNAELTPTSSTETHWNYSITTDQPGNYFTQVWAFDSVGNRQTSLPSRRHVLKPATLNLAEYEVVFSDEFNGTSLDPDKWNTAFFWGPYQPINAEEQVYLDTLGLNADSDYSPFEFTGSTLKIIADETSALASAPAQPDASDPIWASDPDKNFNPNYDEADVDYLSGLITSSDSFNFTHGYAETRAKLPAGAGLWSAFWLLTTKYVEDVPEIDIMEALGHAPEEIYHTLHYFDIENNWAKVSSPTYVTTGPDFTEDFHTFGVSWTPDLLIWYVDGIETRRVNRNNFTVPKQAMYLLANLAVGGSWPGSPTSETIFPAVYELDYIRVYQKKPPAKITPAVLRSDFKLMFADEFSGNTLDTSKWNSSFLWGPYLQINNEEQFYIDKIDSHANSSINPFTFENGRLVITADNADPAAIPTQPSINDSYWQLYPTYQHVPGFQESGGWNPGYSSGMITSYDAFKFVNGYVEIRARVPQGNGLWPAFWLLNAYYVGPMPEIDVLELKGEAPDTIHHSYHYFNGSGELVSSATTSIAPQGEAYSDRFHTYGIEWRPGVIKWYIDGEVVRELNDTNVSRQLMYIILNLAVGGNFVGDVDPGAMPARFVIDYVRAYQRK
ncbi:family 16 glycosylhydrolase [Granulosicoccus sp. 3-233]|uniref:family 16 glycosylhydrolase n=1 Tax=Granulosicoccus sp. 3-233 TaxID=3417969 RepID=UPI003D34DD1D